MTKVPKASIEVVLDAGQDHHLTASDQSAADLAAAAEKHVKSGDTAVVRVTVIRRRKPT